MTRILGIETSCDETAAAVVEDGRVLLSNVVASQISLHQQYGGVFPEIASRQHILSIDTVIRQALEQADITLDEIDAIAVVHGPGLAGALLVGLNTAKALAYAANKPLLGINHLEAHVYANWLLSPGTPSLLEPWFPLVCLVVSGGHTDLILMEGYHRYQLLGHTIDDAAGEAFDKVARLLGLGYPGGPVIQRTAEGGNPQAFHFPRGQVDNPYDFSFSGLKTAVLRQVQALRRAAGQQVEEHGEKLVDAASAAAQVELPLADLTASFQSAVVDALVSKTAAAAQAYGAQLVLLAGGVAANKLLRMEMTRRMDVEVRFPPISFCTDNAAMVAAAGHYRYIAGLRSGLDLDVDPSLQLVSAEVLA
ncbi:MAG: tRNA (adenosine(37)-N6)-threonylcarbamoyltransferase complex transferase subunit TsaD [Chloroflexi bacterium]|nr:tRNA (adenosine(37)-N6)-threonylcarbamoyltransferase complex transferase subunit TsaD [Chloroflexota bacterium]